MHNILLDHVMNWVKELKKISKKAIELYQLSANQNHPWGQNCLAVCYEDGQGVEKNLEEAVRLYKLASNQGCSLAQYNLAICYEGGKVVKKKL